MPTLQLNATTQETIQLDPASENWLNVCRRNSHNQRSCAIPKKYFDILFNWGYVTGTPGNAKISPAGMSRLIGEEQSALAVKKQSKKTTHAPARRAGEIH